MAIADRNGLPVTAFTASASPHEVTLVGKTIDSRFVDPTPELLIGDRAYDSDPLDQEIREEYGNEVVAPHKENRRKPATQDGRQLRRYVRRWKVERLFAWLQNYRRVVVRWERHQTNYEAIVQIACLAIVMKRYL
jgi:transposase